MKTPKYFLPLLPPVTLMLMLGGCDNPPVSYPPPPADPIVIEPVQEIDPQVSQKISQANTLYQQGRKREAAQTYFQAGKLSVSPQRERLILQASEVASMLPDRKLMQEYLQEINPSRLNRENAARYDYVKALLLLTDQKPQIALDILPRQLSGLPAGLANKIRITRLKAADRTGNAMTIIRERASQDALLNAQNKASNRNEIWKQANRLSEQQLNQERNSPNKTVQGWLDLAYIKKYSEAGKVAENIALWRKNFPGHAASSYANDIAGSTKEQPSTPSGFDTGKSTAVLLPLSGNMSNIGHSLFRGIEDAHKRNSGGPALKKYDTSNTDASVLYSRAINDGVGFVLGPFSKNNLVSMSRNGYLNVPALALNYLPAGHSKPSGLIQMGLLPEDEAIQVAQTGLGKSLRKAAVAVPDSAWGRRLEKAFADAYTSRGGSVVQVLRFANRATGYSQDISNLMNDLKGSAQMLFLAASPTQARLIFPAIKAANGDNIPVYSTSHIFSGRPFPSLDSNLDGIVYTEIPWVLKNSREIPDEIRYPRLYALGLDAFTVSRRIGSLQKGSAVKGNTGTLRYSSDGTIHRTLQWATFENGYPQPASP